MAVLCRSLHRLSELHILFPAVETRVTVQPPHSKILFQRVQFDRCSDNLRVADWHTHVCTASIMLSLICMHMHVHTCRYDRCQPFTMRQGFKGDIYCDDLAETCSDILRAWISLCGGVSRKCYTLYMYV